MLLANDNARNNRQPITAVRKYLSRRQRAFAKLVATMLCTFTLAGCVDDQRGDPIVNLPETAVDLAELMTNFADNIIIPNYEAVAAASASFAASNGPLETYCAALGQPGEAAAELAAEDAWRSLAAAIQQSDLHALGPVLDNNAILLNRLNSYNSDELSTCGVDASTVENANDPNFNLQVKTANQKGIGALEFLLFNDDLTFTCPSSLDVTNQWNLLNTAQQRQLRCDYAAVILDDIDSAAQAIVAAWQPSGGNYRGSFLNTGALLESFNAVSDALFALELQAKDKKLGNVLGIRSDCLDTACPDFTEARYSENSLQNIEDNLLAFQQLFYGRDALGTEGLGFDDFIIGEGFQATADAMTSVIDDALAYVATIKNGTSLFDQATAIEQSGDSTSCDNSNANPDSVQTVPACSLHGYMKRITDLLRTDFLVAVNLDLPESGQGDND